MQIEYLMLRTLLAVEDETHLVAILHLCSQLICPQPSGLVDSLHAYRLLLI